MTLIENIKDESSEQYGFGCIFGNFIADACGSKDEFVRKALTEDQLVSTMQMPGGGFHKTGPGQGTDDSELATMLMLGIIDGNI